MEFIIHVIVAFNDPKTASTLLFHISQQGETKHNIICVDNSTNPQSKIKNVCDDYNQRPDISIRYIKTNNNLGSAGGFALGMQLAYNLGAEWIWLHDHDGYPCLGCLEKSLPFLLQKHYYLLSPYIVDENGVYLNVLHGTYDTYWNLNDVTFDGEITKTDVAGSAGLFINRKVIDLIGVYDYINYFVGYEDFDYCLRARRLGIETAVLKASCYFHPNKWSDIKRTNKKKTVIYYGHINNSVDSRKMSKAHIVYSTKFNSRNFWLSLIFTIIMVAVKKIGTKNIRLVKTYSTLLKAVKDRYAHKKIVFDTQLNS
jgi:GT2 family glycosyltransferase